MVKVGLTIDAGAARGVAEQMRPERLEQVLVKALRRAMNPVVKTVQANTPLGKTSTRKQHLAGLLKRSIRFRVDSRPRLRARITAAPYGHLVETGHKLVRNGRTYGRVQAHPFVRPVVDDAIPEVQQVVSDEVIRALTLAARIGKATGRGL